MIIIGVDEVGRGPLAGPVLAGAVIFDPNKKLILGLKDSKLLSPKKRENLAVIIKNQALSWAIGRATVQEIDEINILQASLLAMDRAVKALILKIKKIPPLLFPESESELELELKSKLIILVDGNQVIKNNDYPVKAIVSGDKLIPEISAASIIAKVQRDQEMSEYDNIYPGYNFARHKGYATKEHREKISLLGRSLIHRQSFKIKN